MFKKLSIYYINFKYLMNLYYNDVIDIYKELGIDNLKISNSSDMFWDGVE